jgi:hypothetical protein
MRLLIMIFVLILQNSVFGQIINSISADNSGMIYYSVDTLIKTIVKDRNVEKIFLRSDISTIRNFPDVIQYINIEKNNKSKELVIKKMGVNDLLFIINGLGIIRDQVTVSIATLRKKDKSKGRGLEFIEFGVYTFISSIYLLQRATY